MRDTRFTFSNGWDTLTVHGNLEHNLSLEFKNACTTLLESGHDPVHIDLRQTQFIASPCLGALIMANERSKEDGRTLHVKVSRPVYEIFELLALQDVIKTEIIEK